MSEPKYDGHRVPRDLGRYEPTAHFMERLKYRTDPEPTESIVRETVTQGRVKNTDDSHVVIFEHDDGLHTWRVLAEVNPDAFERETAYHDLLTVYALGVHDGDHPEVFDVGAKEVRGP